MKRALVLALAVGVSGCDCGSNSNDDAGSTGGGGGGSATGGGSANGGGAGRGATDSGSGCQWTLTGQVALSGTCGTGPLIGFTTSSNIIAIEVDTDANVTIGTFKFAAEKTGSTMPVSLDTGSATAFGGTLVRLSDSATWSATKTNALGSFNLVFSDPGTSQAVAGGAMFIHTHGTLDVTAVPTPGGTNPATGNEAFHAVW